MSQEPYKSAQRVFWNMDNGSVHRDQRAADRFHAQWPNAILIHTGPRQLAQSGGQIYFLIVQRKALTPNDFSSWADLEPRLSPFKSITNGVSLHMDLHT